MSRWHPETLEERFLKRVKKTPTCWLWTGRTGRGGYGVLPVRVGAGRRYPDYGAHRVSASLYLGPPPFKGALVCHQCDNPLCVRPSHIFYGTCGENSADMARKGRSTPGERNPQAKLTLREVRVVRRLRARGEKLRVLAERFGVAESTISRIVAGVRWGRVA